MERKLLIVLLCCLALPAFGQRHRTKIAAITVAPAALDTIDSVTTDIQKYSDDLKIEALAVSYRDGKSLEQVREMLSTQARAALDVSSRLRQEDSIALAVGLSQTLWSIRDSINGLSDALRTAGENTRSEAAVRAAIPLVRFNIRLFQPLNRLDQRVREIAAAGDSAVGACLPR